jgi:hypothetical protein
MLDLPGRKQAAKEGAACRSSAGLEEDFYYAVDA